MSLAIAQLHNGDLKSAENSFKRAVGLDKKLKKGGETGTPDFMYQFNVGNVYALLAIREETEILKDEIDKNYGLAVAEYKKMISSEVSGKYFYHPWRNLGLLYYWNGEYGESVKALEGARAMRAFNSRESDFNRKLLNQYLNSAKRILSGEEQPPTQEQLTADIKGILEGNFITHGGLSDPFFLVEHGKSYGCNVQ